MSVPVPKSAESSSPAALIVGASGTLGGAIARELIARKYSLGLHYHLHKEPCERLAQEAAAAGVRAQLYAADFNANAAEAPAALAAAFMHDFPRIDALIWASGIVRDALAVNLKDDDVQAVLNVDVRALFLTLKAFSRPFIKQKSGCVVALSSHAALAGRIGGESYAMAHAALLALIKSTAREWGGVGVRVNAVLPPFLPESGMGQNASPRFVEAARARRVLKKEADAGAAIGKFVAELLENPIVSGQVLCVDSRI